MLRYNLYFFLCNMENLRYKSLIMIWSLGKSFFWWTREDLLKNVNFVWIISTWIFFLSQIIGLYSIAAVEDFLLSQFFETKMSFSTLRRKSWHGKREKAFKTGHKKKSTWKLEDFPLGEENITRIFWMSRMAQKVYLTWSKKLMQKLKSPLPGISIKNCDPPRVICVVANFIYNPQWFSSAKPSRLINLHTTDDFHANSCTFFFHFFLPLRDLSRFFGAD